MAVNINVPSQVRIFANLAAFPATGALKTIYIAEDTNKTYRWTGSVYVEVSGADFSGYVPTSRTLTINGTTQDLSADRTFTISTGITIGTTAITSGTVGRVLFQGAGNVVQQSSSLFWDATNNRLGVGTSSPSFGIDVVGGARFLENINYPQIILGRNTTRFAALTWDDPASEALFQTFARLYPFVFDASLIRFMSNGFERMRIFNSGNIGINTTTDAGFRLDVNGTARVQGRIDAGTFTAGAGASAYTIATTGRISASGGISFRSPLVGDSIFIGFAPIGTSTVEVYTSSTRIFQFGGAGGDPAGMAVATPNFNPSSGTGNKSIFEVNGVYNTTGTFTGTIRGFYYNPTLTSMTGVTAHYAFHSKVGRIRFEGLPTSPVGLASGEVWNNLGILTIV